MLIYYRDNNNSFMKKILIITFGSIVLMISPLPPISYLIPLSVVMIISNTNVFDSLSPLISELN